LAKTTVVTSSDSRACVHKRLRRIHRPASPWRQTTFLSGQATAAPVATGNALPDRTTGQRKMIVRLDIGGKSMNAAACGCAFVGN